MAYVSMNSFIQSTLIVLSLLSILHFPLSAHASTTQDQRVTKVYDHFQGKLIWIKDGRWTSCAQVLLQALAHAKEEGLQQEAFAPLLADLNKTHLNTPEAQQKADALLTSAALDYISQMKGSRLDPHEAVKEIYVKPVALDEVEELKKYLSLPDQCGWVHGLAPATPEYQHLKRLLASYRHKQEQGGWPQLPQGTKLEKGDRGLLVETLKAQLMAQDALPPQGQAGDTFDAALEESVKDYQILHGLEPDGKVGGETLTALNTSIEDRIRSIIVNLERHRWFSSPLPTRYVQVNIPGFYLKAVDGGKTAFFMPIITGKEHTKTPVFNAEMTEVIFNPAWHVPASIARELMPKISRNPGAYAAKGYHVSGGKIIQNPGVANALGKIRFTIDSPFSIYLHGTPQKGLFSKAHRAFSHGCIRVQDPVRLAEFVFQDPEEWSRESIEEESSGTETNHVKLSQKLPVFVTYFTVFEKDNKMHFVADEYGQDKKLWHALEGVGG
jgi:murein L,D-transpeptidase YcbB/YkuD